MSSVSIPKSAYGPMRAQGRSRISHDLELRGLVIIRWRSINLTKMCINYVICKVDKPSHFIIRNYWDSYQILFRASYQKLPKNGNIALFYYCSESDDSGSSINNYVYQFCLSDIDVEFVLLLLNIICLNTLRLNMY